MNKTSKALLLIIASIFLITIAVSCSLEQTTLILGTAADNPPYAFHINQEGSDTIVGFDIDIANAIAEAMGMELEIKDMNFGELLTALEQDQVDMVIAGMTPTEERNSQADFSMIYYNATYTAVLREGMQQDYKDLTDLDGLNVGVQKDSVQYNIIRENVDAKEITIYDKITDLVQALKSGMVDAIFLETPVAEAYCDAVSGIAMSAIVYEGDEGGAAVAVKKGNLELLDKVNATLTKLLENKKIDEFIGAAHILLDNSVEQS